MRENGESYCGEKKTKGKVVNREGKMSVKEKEKIRSRVSCINDVMFLLGVAISVAIRPTSAILYLFLFFERMFWV
jgi:hypothetical protein